MSQANKGMRARLTVASVFISFLGVPAAAQEKAVSLESLLSEMASRESSAQLASPAYVCKEASSHDQLKTNPADATTSHSNKDFEQFIRTEKNDGRNEWVIMEHEGPGAVTRMWLPLLADRDKQVIRFYFDGSTTPAIVAPFNELLSEYDFVKPPLAYVAWNTTDPRQQPRSSAHHRGVGGDLYLPIPFAKNCKITLDQLPFYYIINYRAYEPGTAVQTFSMSEFNAAKADIDRVSQSLLTEPAAGAPTAGKNGMLKPGEELVLDLPPGSAAVQKLQVKLSAQDAQAIRSAVLTAAFDDEADVWCPLSEFFGAGARSGAVKDRFRSVNSDGTLTSNWIMPYQHSGRVGLTNLGKTPITVSIEASTGAWQWDERSLHFHATWHSQHGIPTRPRFDWNYLDAKGRGAYVGDTLTVYSSVPDWYGDNMEIWNWADTRVDYAVGTFWYARPGATSNREPQPEEAGTALREAPPGSSAGAPSSAKRSP